jgi:hypothetical protein
MKTITKSDLKGLVEIFPVYDEDAMRTLRGGERGNEVEALMANFANQSTGSYGSYGDPFGAGGLDSSGYDGSYGGESGYGSGYNGSYGNNSSGYGSY